VQNACNGYFGSGGALLQGNTISGTLPPSTAGCSYGEDAAVFLKGNSTTLPAVQVIGNIIENNVHPLANSGAITINGYIGAIVEDNIIRNNAMTGIYAVNTNSMVIAQNLVYGNTSGGLSAGIPFSGIGPPVGPPIGIIANNTFVQNSGSQVSLGGNLSQFDFVNNIVVCSGPAAPFLCGYPPADSLSLTPIVIDHNDIYNSSGQAYGTGCPDSTGTYGNISADPQFANPSTQDLHIQSGSPAIDAGNTSVQGLLTKDFDNNPRLQDATGKLYPVVDMGAYEFQGLSDANPTTIVLKPSLFEVSGGASITLTAKLLSANGVPTGSVTLTKITPLSALRPSTRLEQQPSPRQD
jgi:parallel beta-helix repeat protein